MALLTLLSTSSATATGNIFNVRGNLTEVDTGLEHIAH